MVQGPALPSGSRLNNDSRSPRIVSLLPAATEMVCRIGAEDWLVGRSHECDFTASVTRLPVVTRSTIDVHGDSRAIHEQVLAGHSGSQSVFTIDVPLLQSLRPTHVLTQIQCDVCAIHLADVERALTDLPTPRPQIVALSAASLTDVWSDLRQIGAALGITQQTEIVIEELRERFQRLRDLTTAICGERSRPRVLCLEWLEPLMAAGNWTPELIALAGGESLLGEAGQNSPWITWEAVRAADPHVLILMPCGFDIARTASEQRWITGRDGWSQLTAVRRGEVYIVDGSQFFNRPGPRLVDSAEIVAEILYPGRMAPDHHETGWIKLHASSP